MKDYERMERIDELESLIQRARRAFGSSADVVVLTALKIFENVVL